MASNIWDVQAPVGNPARVARVESIDVSGRVRVSLEGEADAQARYLNSVKLSALRVAAEAGAGVLVLLEENDPSRPIIIGVLADGSSDTDSATCAEVDGERVVLTGREEVTLRCGKASITLTKAGKVIMRGAYLLSRSSGANRIKGGSVQIN